MKLVPIISSLALMASLAAGGIWLTPAYAGERGNWLSIPQIHDRLEAAGYRNVEKIEREHGDYEARATDSSGQRIKLYINPQTGEILQQQRRYNRVASDRGDDGRRDSRDCNKRRCRDDLPQNLPPTTATPAPFAK